MSTSSEYVQYGCGLCAPEGWLNFDGSPSVRLQRLPVVGSIAGRLAVQFPAAVRYGDIVRGLPVAERSVRAIYCSHVLEHLSLNDCRRAIANTFRVLKPGGCFRVVLPDLRASAEAYVASGSAGASHEFLRTTLLGREDRIRSLPRFLREEWLGNSKHQWMWDFQSLSTELKNAGFVKIRRAAMGDNPDPELAKAFAKVEEASRWQGQLGIECHKPG